MKKQVVLLCASLLVIGLSAQTLEFEAAKDAVKNMRVGWNLGNTLDATSGDTTNMWIEKYTNRTPDKYETAWGQPVTKPELFKMFKEAGFNAIRLPVTWYPHMGSAFFKSSTSLTWSPTKQPLTGDVDPAWMKRVHEIVDYIISQDMYCVLNVHHDTGTSNAAWLIADGEVFEKNKALYTKLWTQIAEEFKDYGEKLVFESYNEMLDKYDSWCFASMNAPDGYSRADANDAYNAINNYAQTFVDAVRATGGNNTNRNLVVTTYAACSGKANDTWSEHLNEPFTKFVIPTDTAVTDGKKHLILQIHYYQQNLENLESSKNHALATLTNLRSIFPSYKIPIIIGEWGSLNEADNGNGDYNLYRDNLLEYCKYFMQQTKKRSIATFYWKGLSDGDSRSVPVFDQPDLLEAIMEGYYGGGGYNGVDNIASDDNEYQYIYKLDGTRASDMNTPGFYIVNGKKYYKN